MPVDSLTDHQHRVIVITVRGAVRIEDVFGYQKQIRLRMDVSGYGALIDATEVEQMVQPSADQIRALAASARLGHPGSVACLAIAAPSDFLFGLFRMFQAYCDQDDPGAGRVGVFRSPQEAAAFLQLPAHFRADGAQADKALAGPQDGQS